jgi:hypothetical protein
MSSEIFAQSNFFGLTDVSSSGGTTYVLILYGQVSAAQYFTPLQAVERNVLKTEID